MSTSKYARAGVNIAAGDAASSAAGRLAATTFTGRAGRIGAPVRLPGGFAGALDFGNFYVVTCDDGTGTKMAVAEATGNFSGIGADLVAMVADDAVCLGAEVISVSNTLDCQKVEKKTVEALLTSLAKACRTQKIVIPGGEIAEVGKTVNGLVWNATAIGVVAKKQLITGEKIRPGDAVLALQEKGLRSNGFSLARYILQKAYGKGWEKQKFGAKTWGQWLLTPSTIYHAAILSLVGRFGEKAALPIHGVVHVTGGGIPGNLPRLFRDKKLGAHLPDLWPVPPFVAELIRLGKVSAEEAREVWNLGNGMLVVLPPQHAAAAIQLLKKAGVAARLAGEINASGKITF